MTTVCLLALAATSAFGQVRPFDLFLDLDGAGNLISPSQCDLINAGNARLVVLTETAQLVIVDGSDVTLADTFVAANGDVTFEGDPAGFITFQDDGDALRTLWWVSLTGFVVDVDGFTGRPTVTTVTPANFTDVDCDACDFWDDQSVCGECSSNADCDDGNVCTDDTCSAGVCLSTNNIIFCNDGDACTTGDLCLFGVCAGSRVADCDVDDDDDTSPPPILISFCGSGLGMILPLSLLMLGFAKLRLRGGRSSRRAIARNTYPGRIK